MTNFLKKLKTENGMTIPELLIAMGILSMTLAGAFSLLQLSEDSWSTATNRMDTRGEAARTLSVLVKTIQSAEDNDNTKGLIAEANTSTVTFYANVDTDSLPEKVKYSRSGTNLVRTVYQPTNGTKTYTYSGAEASTIVFEDVDNDAANPLFSYYENDTPITIPMGGITGATLNDIKMVGIDLRTVYDNSGHSENNSLTSRVFLRNLR
jgi:prepilin-type N-terminal cleavage/methylation domain-containing protein